VSGNGSPAHPRAARRARGPLVRPIASLRIQLPRLWSPAAGNSPARVLSEHSGHPGKAPGHPDAPIGGGPIPLTTGLLTSNDSSTASRHTASSHYTRLVLTPRAEPRAELRHPCAPRRPDHARWPRWLRLPAQNWRCFFARYQRDHGPLPRRSYCHPGHRQRHGVMGTRSSLSNDAKRAAAAQAVSGAAMSYSFELQERWVTASQKGDSQKGTA
jgi:hypothetical protein